MARIGPGGSTPFSFGEVIAGNNPDDLGKLRTYTCKNGIGNCKSSAGNRDVLDFPLLFTMQSVLNGSGGGSMRQLERASVDIIDGDPNDGTVGVQFVQNHDGVGAPPAANNIAYAHILTRSGYPIVYFNARQFSPPNFPREGRGDALGGQFGTLITTLVDIHDRYRRGRHLTRFVDDDVYAYELDRSMIVGLNDHKTFDANRTIQTSFPTGHAAGRTDRQPGGDQPAYRRIRRPGGYSDPERQERSGLRRLGAADAARSNRHRAVRHQPRRFRHRPRRRGGAEWNATDHASGADHGTFGDLDADLGRRGFGRPGPGAHR